MGVETYLSCWGVFGFSIWIAARQLYKPPSNLKTLLEAFYIVAVIAAIAGSVIAFRTWGWWQALLSLFVFWIVGGINTARHSR
jgi:hypothetical protein